MPTLLVLDTETASLKGGVVELAFVTLTDDLEIQDQHCTLVDPERDIDPGAFAIHGITREQTLGKPTLAEVVRLLPEKSWIIGHNCSFDMRMIAPAYKPDATLCTLALSRQYVKNTTNHKLGTLQAELGLPNRTTHSALEDVLTTLDLLRYILPLTGKSVRDLFVRQMMPRMVSKMPFGKYKGVPILQVPKDYRAWFLTQEIDKDLKYTLEKFNEI